MRRREPGDDIAAAGSSGRTRRARGLADHRAHGSLGENLTVQGLLEAELFVGDVLRFPDCELRVTQPRRPCHKFAAFFGDPLAPKKMVQTGYCGFYLAVDRPGRIEAVQACDLTAGPRQTPLMALFPTAGRRQHRVPLALFLSEHGRFHGRARAAGGC